MSVPTPPKTAGVRPDKATLCGGRWTIVSAGTFSITGEDEMPYIEFEDGTGRFYTYDGCNYINGDYLLRTDGTMLFSNVITTSRYCGDNEWNISIAMYLKDGSSLYVDTADVDTETYLYLRTANDKVVMTLRRHNMEFLNGSWIVTKIGDISVDDEECTIFFDIADLKVYGSTGCNHFNGVIYINTAQSSALDLSGINITYHSCANAEREMKMMVALESTVTALEKDGDVCLYDADGTKLITLKRSAQ